MGSDDSRPSNLHIPVAILLMACIVMFIGSLYYLAVKGPWIFNPEINQKTVSLTKNVETLKDTQDPRTLGEALNILFEKNCTVISYNIDSSKYDIRQTTFQVLSEKAIQNQVVIVTTINEEAVLLVLENGRLWVWSP